MKTKSNPGLSDGWRVTLWAAFIGLVALISVLTTTGCVGTVVPAPVESAQASFDGSEQNSGVIMSVPSGFVVTSHFRERYNALIAIYGGDFKPPLKPDSQVAPIGEDRWLLGKQGMSDMLLMNAWQKAGLKPKN